MTVMTDLTRRAATYIGDHGWVQNRAEDDDGRVCIAGALRACADTDTDRAVTQAILRARGRGEDWNDQPGRTVGQVRDCLAASTVTECDLTGMLGPNWRHLMSMLRRAESLTAVERQRMSARPDTGGAWVARHVARDLASEHGRAAVEHIEAPPVGVALSDDCGAIGDALWGISTRDLIGQHGYTREDYAVLTGEWARVIGPAHPEDGAPEASTR